MINVLLLVFGLGQARDFVDITSNIVPPEATGERAYIGCVTSFETSYINFEWLCSINDMFSICI